LKTGNLINLLKYKKIKKITIIYLFLDNLIFPPFLK
jgi:hypothetical protein